MGAPVSVVGLSVDYYATWLMVPSGHLSSPFISQYLPISIAETADEKAED